MGMKFKKGDQVRQVAPVIQGAVTELRIVDDEVQFAVEYEDAEGETHKRFFKEDELEAVEAEAEGGA